MPSSPFRNHIRGQSLDDYILPNSCKKREMLHMHVCNGDTYVVHALS